MMPNDPITIDSLDLGTLPEGEITAAWLNIAEDGLGQAVSLPLLIAKGRKAGPVCGISAAVHGDELNGIPAIHRLFQSLDLDRLRGTIVAVVVANPLAFHRRDRRLDEGADLNHMFPGRRQGSLGQVLASRIRKHILRQVDVLLDLHTASRGRVNSLYVRADMSDLHTARLAYLQRPEIIVHNPPSDGTFRGAAASLGVPAITVEIGDPSRFQPAFTRRTTAGIRAVLVDLGMVTRRPVTLGDPPVVCASSGWTYTQRGGLLRVEVALGQLVQKGEVMARIHDVFGRETATIEAPSDGIVVGHAVDPVAPTGTRVVHLGQVAGDQHEHLLDRERAIDTETSPWKS